MSSATDLITTYDQFNANKITYGTPKVDKRGGKSIKILDSRKNTLIITTPLMLTWGINQNVDEKTGALSFNLSLQFPNNDNTNTSISKFLKSIQNFEERILDDAVKNSITWFNDPDMEKSVAKKLFTPVLKYPKDKATNRVDTTRPPSMRVKIPYWDEKFNVELYDTDRTPLYNGHLHTNVEDFMGLIPKASHITCILQCGGIWYVNGKFGVTWQLVQSMVRRPTRIQGGCFLTLSSEDKAIVESVEKREKETQSKDLLSASVEEHDNYANVESSDDGSSVASNDNGSDNGSDNDDDDEPVISKPVEKPVAPVKRKVVRKTVVKK